MMNNKMELNLDELKTVTGGDSLRDRAEYKKIKEYYVTKGTRLAIELALALGYTVADARETARIIGEEIEQDNNNSNSF